ncbi:MAG TPA: DUF779 domain-containing protein [Virgibacillus sp.]|nr:DUF779 domain-containing protein [Virgibacillus sp.]HLR67983.1 DUF779 domain-containing protein [Virgibacillus sp.]
MDKVIITDEATKLITLLKEEHGELIFVHSEGCCEGTSPLCTTREDFYVGSQDEQIGEVAGVPYYMHVNNQSYWTHLQIIIDVTNGINNSFSLESTKDKTFVIQSKPF